MVEEVIRTRVAWVDTDAGARIHFTAVFRWAEAAETELLRRLGLLKGRWGDYPRRKVEAEYLKVLRFDDEIEVRLRVEKVGRTSVTYAWSVAKDGEPHVKGRHTVVHVDGEGRPEPLDDGLRALLDG
ncbi:MAG TPA: thioesterase family protein [Gaiellaceae bacterium]|nr:thioesterase family protein [Gaiellaceae bacterium]